MNVIHANNESMEIKIPVNWTHAPGNPAQKNPSDVYEMLQKFIAKITRKARVSKVDIAVDEHKNSAGIAHSFTAKVKVFLDKGKQLFAHASGKKVGIALHDAFKKVVHEEEKIIDKNKMRK
jgi:hypothetical protein